MTVTAPDAHRAIDAVWKLESARIVAGLTRIVRDVGLAEELAQDALVAALEQWPREGVPDNPGAWLMTTAKRRAVDHLRRSERLERKHGELAHTLEQQSGDEPGPAGDDGDVLRLMFVSCHPVLAPEARAALTLRLLGGLTTDEIARAFLLPGPTVGRRIAHAKRTLAAERVPFDLPAGPELAARLASVLEVVYLIFNEGYAATSGDGLMRPALCLEALRLGRRLAVLAPHHAEVHGLVALMEIQASRAAARTGPDGEPVQLHEQNRGRWDQLLVRRGFAAMLRAREAGGPPGPYVLQAAIAVCHAQARAAADTDWARITVLYDALARILPTPVVRLNRAVAVGMARGPQAGLGLVDELALDPVFRDYHPLSAVRGDLLARLGRHDGAAAAFERAAALTRNAPEQAFLLRRAATARAATARAGTAGPSLGRAAEEFLARTDLDPATLRSYGQTLRRLCLDLGAGTPLAGVTPADVARVFAVAWGAVAARTWNRHRAAVRSLSAWAAARAPVPAPAPDLAAALPRRAEDRRPRPAVGGPQLAALWEIPAPPREQVLWRILHESGASAAQALALDVGDLAPDGRSARLTTPAGPLRLTWRPATAALLRALLAGRTRGPLFLADRRPGPGRRPAAADLCPDTGRGRLSYERAEHLFKQATRAIDPAGTGFTLHRLSRSGARPAAPPPAPVKGPS